jgi:hypothetical protein
VRSFFFLFSHADNCSPPKPRRFVSAIHIPHVLVSGGGDLVLKVWEWRVGRRLYDIAIEETVRPFIAVRRARRKRGYDSDGERKPPTRRWLARERRRQAKAATPSKEEAEVAVESGDEADHPLMMWSNMQRSLRLSETASGN